MDAEQLSEVGQALFKVVKGAWEWLKVSGTFLQVVGHNLCCSTETIVEEIEFGRYKVSPELDAALRYCGFTSYEEEKTTVWVLPKTGYLQKEMNYNRVLPYFQYYYRPLLFRVPHKVEHIKSMRLINKEMDEAMSYIQASFYSREAGKFMSLWEKRTPFISTARSLMIRKRQETEARYRKSRAREDDHDYIGAMSE